MRMRAMGVPVLLLAGLAWGQAGEHAWKDYGNPRFKFFACYPADLLKAQPEPENGDGLSFKGHGAELVVYGANNVMEGTPATDVKDEIERLGPASYKLVKADRFVISGRKGDTVYYEKVLYVKGVTKTMQLTYPADQAGVWDGLTAKMSACFRAGL